MTTLDALVLALLVLLLMCVPAAALVGAVAGAWLVELLWSWLWS